MIKVIRDTDGFNALKPRWDDLVNRNSTALVFQTFDWNYAVWQDLEVNKELFIIYATRDGHADEHVIFPFCKTLKGELKFIASNVSDVLDAIYPEHDKDWHVLYAEVARFLSENSEIKSVELSKVHGEAELARYLPAYMRDVVMARMDAHSGILWKQSEEPTRVMYNLNSKERSYVRSMLKYSSHEIIIASKRLGYKYPRDKIIEIRDWMIANGWRNKNSLPMAYFVCLEKLYENGLCEVSLAINKNNGECNLVAFRLPFKNRIVFWLVMYNISKLVTICDAMYIAERLKNGDTYFDWGTGMYSYKLGTFRPDVHNLYSLRTKPLTIKTCFVDILSLLRRYLRALAIRTGIKKDRFHPAMCKH